MPASSRRIKCLKGLTVTQKITISLIDDLAKGMADVTHSFTFDGRDYEIDLSEVQSKQLIEVLGPFIASSRKVHANSRTRSNSANCAGQSDLAIAPGVQLDSAPNVPTPTEIHFWAVMQRLTRHVCSCLSNEVRKALARAHYDI